MNDDAIHLPEPQAPYGACHRPDVNVKIAVRALKY
jgi:hypothetical protein